MHLLPWKCNPVISGCTPSCCVAVTGGHRSKDGSAVVTCLHKWRNRTFRIIWHATVTQKNTAMMYFSACYTQLIDVEFLIFSDGVTLLKA